MPVFSFFTRLLLYTLVYIFLPLPFFLSRQHVGMEDATTIQSSDGDLTAGFEVAVHMDGILILV